MRSINRTTLSLAMAVAATAAPAIALTGTAALADPVDAHHAATGTADCGSTGTFTFVVTSNSGKGTPWNVAFATSTTDGGRAVFHPSSIDLTISTADGTFPEQDAKPGGPGPITCTITDTPFPGATLTGTVTGTVTWRG